MTADPRYPFGHGFCGCGCGQRTNVVARSNARKYGYAPGERYRFVIGHFGYVRNYPQTDPIERMAAGSHLQDLGYTTPCRVWDGPKNRQGYGRFYLGSARTEDRRTIGVHIAAWELHHGRKVAAGKHLDHLCHPDDGSCPGGPSCPHRLCCEPSHLAERSPKENNLRSRSISALNAKKTHCKRGHPLSGENLYLAPQTGYRQCRICRRLRKRTYRRRGH